MKQRSLYVFAFVVILLTNTGPTLSFLVDPPRDSFADRAPQVTQIFEERVFASEGLFYLAQSFGDLDFQEEDLLENSTRTSLLIPRALGQHFSSIHRMTRQICLDPPIDPPIHPAT